MDAYTICLGSSGSGKTVFAKKMISSHVEPELKRVIWFYGEWQSGYADMPSKVQLIPGMPENLDKFLGGCSGEATAFVFDDLMSECVNNNMIAEAFTKKRHHRGVSVIVMVQNLFIQGKVMRTIHLNSEYIILFGNIRDKSQFAHFARQLEPTHSKRLLEAYIDATKEPYSHFLVDLKTLTPNPLRYRSDSLSNDMQIVYTVSGM